MTNPITVRTALEVASHEALVRQTYYDSVKVPTWCVGMTNATGHNVERYWGKPQPLQRCMDLYVWALDNYANAVRNRFRNFSLTEEQFTGILSWTWNVGEGWLQNASWIPHFINGDMVEAERRFLFFDKPPEIKGRRQREADLIFRGQWHNNGKMLEYTRVTGRRTPDWTSGKLIDVRKEVESAISRHTGADASFMPDRPDQTPAPTLTPETAPQPKPLSRSTTIWAAIAQYSAGIITALSALDWKVALPLIAVSGVLAFWIVRERVRKREEYGA